jgi:alpha-mannosidase
MGIGVVDSAGQTLPVQVLEATRHGDGGLKVARLAFLARDIPAMGYCTYQVVSTPAAHSEEPAPDKGDSLENQFYRVALDPTTGAMKSLLVKAGDWEVFRDNANVVAREPDRGDLWELYRGLDGGSKIAMTRQQPVPRSGEAKLSSEFPGKPGTVHAGPVLSEFRVSHPFANGTFAMAVRLYAGVPRVDIATTLVNNEKHVRYQALFPTTIRDGKSVQAIPFGASERPPGIEFPAQEWSDYGDGHRGLALLNIGLPGNVVTDGTMMLSLLRSHTLGAYGFGGGYEPGMTSDSGFELGKERTLRYALVPHAGDWREAGIYRAGLEFNDPLVCRKVLRHDGPLPKRWGFVEVSHPQVVISALKPGRDGTTVLRIYEATGKPVAGAKVKLRARILSAWETNLMEDPGRELEIGENTLQFALAPFEIKTWLLRLDPAVPWK